MFVKVQLFAPLAAPPMVSVRLPVPLTSDVAPVLPVAFWKVEPVTVSVAVPVLLLATRPLRFATLKPEMVVVAMVLVPVQVHDVDAVAAEALARRARHVLTGVRDGDARDGDARGARVDAVVTGV